ncbi:MAG: hypothetical protein QOC64_1432 [Solirubrobacteraceae bacterium]|nr:hypothetical protein [Solirubrobacteraceae bacterium]
MSSFAAPVPVPSAALDERFLDLTPDIAAALDDDGQIVCANPALRTLMGLADGAPVGAHVADLVHPDDHAALRAHWEDLADGTAASAELALRVGPPDGPHRWFLLGLVADRERSLVYAMGKPMEDRHAETERLQDMEERFVTAFDNSLIGMSITSLDARYVRVNDAFARMLGRSAGEIAGMHVSEVGVADGATADAEMVRRLLADPKAILPGEKRYVRADGSELLAAISVSTVAGPDGEPQYFIAQMVDITEQRSTERALAESERRFRTLASASPSGIFSTTLDGRILYANERLAEIFSLDAGERDGHRWLERVEPAWQDRLRLAVASVADGFGPVAMDVRLDDRAGARWARVNIAAMFEADEAGGFVGTVEDVTESVEARAALAAREAEFRAMAEHSGDFLSRHDADGRYLYASPASEAVLGYRPEELVGRTAWELGCIHPDDTEAARSLRAVIDGREELATADFRVIRRDGAIGWLETTVRALPSTDGVPPQIVAVNRDVSARKSAEVRLAHQAMHDDLTGLPNRSLFLDRLEQALHRARRSGDGVAVLFVDLDRFKLINDSFGHAAGDRLLCDVAARLSTALRPSDTIARFGGDELTVLCEDVTGETFARGIAHRIAELFDEPFTVEDSEAFLQASIGIAIGAGDARPEDLIRDADAAMYRAKDRGRGRVEVFDEAMRRDARDRVATESALRRAIEREELHIHVQPVVAIGDGRIQGFEALVRWQHPERGVVAPGEFIPLAEETGLIVPIGNWVLREVCRTLRRWRTEFGVEWVQCSVNLSVRHLKQPDLVATVRHALREFDVPPDRLILEITESAVMETGAGSVETLDQLRALGVRLALDDFGTGYSSLAHLHRFPLDVLKIDRSFTAALGDDHQGASIAGAIVSLGHALGLVTVAEGIEDVAQQRAMERMGCTLGQGYLFARPQPPEAFDDVLRADPRP